MDITFERLALYEEVWTTPLTKLGEKYGMSDNGIRKVCKAMNIPLPAGGHWAKVAAGHTVPRTELPAESERTVFVSRPAPVPSSEFDRPEDAVWLQQALAKEDMPENLIAVDLKPKRWHPVLAPIRERFLEAVKSRKALEKEKAARDARPKLSRRWEPNLDFLKYRALDDPFVLPKRERVFLRVSLETYERALAISNALLFAAARRGCEVTYDERSARMRVQLEGASFSFAMRDRDQKLVLVVDRYPGSEFEIRDRESEGIEHQLNEFFVRLYPVVIKARVEARQEKVKQERLAVQRAAWEKLTQQRELEAKAKADELERRKKLIAEADQWQHATNLRRYIAEVASQPTGSTWTVEWVEWASKAADDLDPITRTLPSVNGVPTWK